MRRDMADIKFKIKGTIGTFQNPQKAERKNLWI